MRRLFIMGFPSLYGGAGSELNMQIHLWVKAFPEIKLFIIPTGEGYKNEALYNNMLSLGITICNPMDISLITSDDAIINFCSKEFLLALPLIKEKTDRICWVNCMTWLFDDEKAAASHGFIKHYLYQRDEIRDYHKRQLTTHHGCDNTINFQTFKPYFNTDGFEFDIKDDKKTHIGRISRQDSDKFHAQTLHIYEYIVSPKMKQGHFLGFDQRSEEKIGKPMDWIKTYANQHVLPVTDFWKTIDFIVQPSDTFENLPRIGFEAMFSGKPLVVDNRGGWQHMVKHGITGFLCDTPRDFIYYGSRLSYDIDLRATLAENALTKAENMSSFEVSKDSWSAVFERVFE